MASRVVVNKLLTEYSVSGSGPVVLLLHGWGDRSSTFAELERSLQGNYCVVKLDLPGFGGTQAPDSDWGLSDYAEFVSAFLEKIDQPSLHGLVGHSNGGAVAVKALADNNLKADKLVLIASAGVRNQRSSSKVLARLGAKLVKYPLFLLPRPTRNKVKRRVYGSLGSDLYVADNLQGTFKRIVSEDIQASATTIAVPTLLIYGSEDQDTPVVIGQKLKAAIKDSRLEIREGAGHFVHQDQPAAVANLLLEFLA